MVTRVRGQTGRSWVTRPITIKFYDETFTVSQVLKDDLGATRE